MEIYYDNRTKENISIYKKDIQKALELTLKEEKIDKKIEVNISFVTDEEIKKINKKFRKKDKTTDVLSFPMIDYENGKTYKDMSKSELEQYKNLNTKLVSVGDIVVSIDTIRKQAKEFNNTIRKELLLMVIHSMLHLLGYDHMITEEEKVMFKKQEEILERL